MPDRTRSGDEQSSISRSINTAVQTNLPAPIADHVPRIPESGAELKANLKEEAAAAKNGLMGQLRALTAGGFGGVCAVLVGHPFDLIKVRLQTAEKGVYTSAMDVARKSVARDGFRGLYAGVSAPLLGVTPMFAVSFWGYDVGQRLVRAVAGTSNTTPLTMSQLASAGFFSAIPMTLITAPFERVKILLQVQGQQKLNPSEKPRFNGTMDVVKHLYKTGGIRSVYRGSAATLARDGPGSAAYFAAYEYVKERLSPKNPITGKSTGELSMPAIVAAGGAAGIAMWSLIFPVDTVKSRLQTAETNPSISAVIGELYKKGGIKAFFPGFGPAIARAVPANAATFVGVELAHSAMNTMFGKA